VARTLPFQGREAGSEPVRATIIYFRGLGKSGSIRLVWGQEIVGSNPTFPTSFKWGISSVGRASALHVEGQRFEPVILHQI
jgi:hypothetical protein